MLCCRVHALYAKIISFTNRRISVTNSTEQVSESPLTKERVKLSLVIPTYNEVANIEDIIGSLSALLDVRLPNNYELIVVDDDSPDETWLKADGLVTRFPQLRVTRRVGCRGVGQAVVYGWKSARGEIVGTINADLQHPPEIICDLLSAIENGADIANGSRYNQTGAIVGWSLSRRIL